MARILIDVRWEGEPTFSGRNPRTQLSDEWPPSPARLFSALVAGAAVCDDPPAARAALEVLETLPAPRIYAGTALDSRDPLCYVPKQVNYPTLSWTVDKDGDLTPPDSSRKERAYQDSLRLGLWTGLKGINETGSAGKYIGGARTLTDPCATFEIDAGSARGMTFEHFVAALDTAAACVPHLGVSTDVATVSVRAATDADTATSIADGRSCFEPHAARGPSRMWAPGFLDHLDARHRSRTTPGAHDIGHGDSVTPRISFSEVRTLRDLVSVTLPAAPVVPPHRIASSMTEVRRALAADDAAAGTTVVPMMVSDLMHGDGRMLGIMVTHTDRAATLAAVRAAATLDWLSAATSGPDPRASMQADRILGPGRRWRTVTPARSYTCSRTATVRFLLDMEAATGVPADTISLHLQPAADVPRPGRVDGIGACPELTAGLVPWHLDVEFPVPVVGPLSVGKDTDLGAGLLIPCDAEPVGAELDDTPDGEGSAR